MFVDPPVEAWPIQKVTSDRKFTETVSYFKSDNHILRHNTTQIRYTAFTGTCQAHWVHLARWYVDESIPCALHGRLTCLMLQGILKGMYDFSQLTLTRTARICIPDSIKL